MILIIIIHYYTYGFPCQSHVCVHVCVCVTEIEGIRDREHCREIIVERERTTVRERGQVNDFR